ncbi:hypothetical protein QJS66_22990 [Kocuria rhizophila]|nr:hypothetical protein QJS66_22990 [Kocuria rhizophila]
MRSAIRAGMGLPRGPRAAAVPRAESRCDPSFTQFAARAAGPAVGCTVPSPCRAAPGRPRGGQHVVEALRVTREVGGAGPGRAASARCRSSCGRTDGTAAS